MQLHCYARKLLQRTIFISDSINTLKHHSCMKQGVEINLTLSATFQGSIDDQHVGNAEADVSLHREQCH